jgi:hypothetical protein
VAIRAKNLPPAVDCKAEASALALGYPTDEVIAIDVLLNPDATMLHHSAENNARLLKAFPKGFSLDATIVRTLPWSSASFASLISNRSTPQLAKSSPIPTLPE